MLIVFARFPVASPFESVLGEEAVQEVAATDGVGMRLRAVDVGPSGGGLHEEGAVGASLDVGVVERVDVYCHATGMVGQCF